VEKKLLNILSYAIAFLALISSTVGLFYTTNGAKYIVQNIYGQDIELYGDGIYAMNSVLKVGTFKGTDLAFLILIPVFIIATRLRLKSKKIEFVHTGLISGFLYYATCQAFSVSYNRLFPVYLLLFSAALYAFIFAVKNIMVNDNIPGVLKNKTLKGTATYMIIGGCSVLVWLSFIIPAFISGDPTLFIEIYTTEPTFILDLGIIFPISIACGIMLFKRNTLGYKLAPIILTLITLIGLCVIGQTVVQLALGIELEIQQMIGLVGSFVILGSIAIVLNMRFMKYIK
jgi:hypothetical protein